MRISDWSSDVCSSDLRFDADPARSYTLAAPYYFDPAVQGRENEAIFYRSWNYEIGRGSCRGRGCEDVKSSVVAVSLKKKLLESELATVTHQLATRYTTDR